MGIPFWDKVLFKWREQKMGSNGCTIPFLVGIQKIINLPKEIGEYNSRSILIDLFNNDDPQRSYWLRICPELKWVIIQKKITAFDLDDSNAKWHGKTYKGESLLLIDDSIINIYGDNDNQIINNLTEESNAKIDVGHFSLNNKTWGNYSDNELKFIDSLIPR